MMVEIDKTRPSHQYREREDTESADKTSLRSLSQSWNGTAQSLSSEKVNWHKNK
jgi:hypothetical protein